MSVAFQQLCEEHDLDLSPLPIEALQLNITRLCNQACAHCHVDASPARTEMMSAATIDACLAVVERTPGISTVDLTGGAPELHPEFERLVSGIRALGRKVLVRHNLTVTLDSHPLTGAAMRHLPRFFAEHAVSLACSLPCYLAENTDAQRGPSVFEKSIESLRLLNAEGYGCAGTGLSLDLVHNPTGFGLAGDQHALEGDYRRELEQRYGVSFNRLLAINNMPINRFGHQLDTTGRREEYAERLRQSCNADVAASVMCRSMVSVAFDGTLYDCDFNQVLGLAVTEGAPLTIAEFDSATLARRRIRYADHCFGCIAGAGSSCGGTLLPA
ncbi:MAG: arsenosugar biosynthesis radical SAM protein ArsS [Anaerosomatales bacterium]|nr:arsenosugar biosynthesis radical SAM protein ArsS [Anaerosomatales bacterium]MDT8434208.1 arsenosugar biosynthesis radical SAM protein ArsS [Anaerosomatales bacterium]